MANWSGLQEDVLYLVYKVSTLPDIIRMGAVCKSWMSVSKEMRARPQLPWLMMLPNNETATTSDARDFFSLSEKTIHTIHLPELRGKRCCGSFINTGWLMTVDEKLEICLFHPWWRIQHKLPHQSTFTNQHYAQESYTPEQTRDFHIIKAAMSSDGFVVMVVYALGDLGFCRVGDRVWIDIPISSSMFEDVIYHKGQFYALCQGGHVYVVHFDMSCNLSPTFEKLSEQTSIYNSVAYLVLDSSIGSMFVVYRNVDLGPVGEVDYPRKTIRFEIYELVIEFEDSKWKTKLVKVESLGDRVMFLGHNSSMIINADKFQGFKGNQIYFTDNYCEGYFRSPLGCRDLGIFNLDDGTFKTLFQDRFHPMMSPPVWVAPPESVTVTLPFHSSEKRFEE